MAGSPVRAGGRLTKGGTPPFRALTEVLTGVGYEVTSDPEDEVSVIARLAPAACRGPLVLRIDR
jgi:hypothetical protein